MDVVVFVCTGVVGCASDSVAIAFSSAGVPIFRAHNLIDDAEPSSPRGPQAPHGDVTFGCFLFLFRKENRS